MLVALLPLVFWYRFRNTKLDRDYAPYCAPAVFGISYLTNGHHDIKPPLIHWGYKVWRACTSWLGLKQEANLRLPIGLAASLSILAVGYCQSTEIALVLALLLISPSLWVHMASTEWLTVLILSLATMLAQDSQWQMWAWLCIGLLPWVNQKNALLLVPVIWALKLNPTPTNLVALCIPGLVILTYLTATGRLKTFWFHCVTMPSQMGRKRTLKQNTLGHLHLLKPGIILMSPFVASMHGPWAVVFAVCVAISLWSKQIVPHHFILWAFPLALACEPTAMTFVAYGILWCFRDLAIWLRPENIYRITFGAPQGDYGDRLTDGEWVARWLAENKVTEVWVNGMDNNVYLQAGIKPWNLIVPEWTEPFEGVPPKVIVHCPGNLAFDYDKEGYEMKEASPRGMYVIMERA